MTPIGATENSDGISTTTTLLTTSMSSSIATSQCRTNQILNWEVQNQRQLIKKRKLSVEQMAKLNVIGFSADASRRKKKSNTDSKGSEGDQVSKLL
jgi:hypothetical protein